MINCQLDYIYIVGPGASVINAPWDTEEIKAQLTVNMLLNYSWIILDLNYNLFLGKS